MEEFAYLVNALLKSKVKGHFVMQNGIIVHNVEPFDDYDEIFEVTFKENEKMSTIVSDKYGRMLRAFSQDDKPFDYDIVKFVKD